MEKEFVRARSVRDVVLSSVLTIAGILLILLSSSIPVNIVGCCLAIPGVLMLIFMKTDYKDAETGFRFRRLIKYFPASKKPEVLAALKDNPGKAEWKEEDASANGLMVDIYAGKNVDKVFVRVSEFIPYNYEPCTDWFSYDEKDVTSLIEK